MYASFIRGALIGCVCPPNARRNDGLGCAVRSEAADFRYSW
jgi:hypothetical protein